MSKRDEWRAIRDLWNRPLTYQEFRTLDCAVCGVNTAYINEFPYVVRDALWEKYGVGEKNSMARGSMLCIGCLEQRMGRTLIKSDFVTQIKGHKLGWLYSAMSERLQQRLRSRRSHQL